MRKRFIPKGQIAYTTRLKPGERSMDKRYKDGVDTGRFSTNRIPLPLKSKTSQNANSNNT